MTIFSSIRRTFLSAALFTTTFAVLGLPLAPAHAADGDLLQKIKAAGEIRIGTEGTYPPYTTMTPKERSRALTLRSQKP